MMWSETYRPLKLDEMVGNEDARLAVIKWLSGWIEGTKPLLLVGPPGVGKTSLVHALVRQFDYDLVEMNASDTRNKIDIQTRITPILGNASIFGKNLLLFLDEVDGIAGREDYGGIDALVDIIKKPSIPIILAANSKNVKIKDLAKSCKVIEFKPISPTMLMLYLEQVLHMEKKDLDISQKMSIVFNSRGDMRSLLNSAQSRASGYATVANSDVIDMDIADAINGYFSSDEIEEAAKYLLKADASYSDPRFGMSAEERRKDMINALFSSIVSSRIDPESLARMLDTISQADVLVGRVAENRQWHLLKYLNPILTYGLFKDSRNKSIKYNQYSMSWPILGPIFARSQSNRNLFKEIASEAHTSRSIFGATYFPYLLKVLLNEKIDPKEFILSNNLEEKYGDALLKEMERMKRK